MRHLSLACLSLLSGIALAETPAPAAAVPATTPAAAATPVAAPVAKPAAAPISSLLATEQQKLSYSFGVIMARNLKDQGAEVDFATLSLGLEHALTNKTPLMNDEQVLAVLVAYSQQRDAAQTKARADQSASNLAEGAAFLAKNRQRAGVITQPSGLQYEILQAGNGTTPKKTDKVTVHYRGTLLDGTEFDSSYKRGKPTSFGVENVIPGWQEGVQLMSPGAKWKLYIPGSLAYGETGVGDIGPNATLTFEVELLSIEPPAPVK